MAFTVPLLPKPQLQRELAQERKRSQSMSAGIADFEVSMARLFTLK
ncbi:hypothetical protein GNZ42_19875 [Salmonella enterica]|nr:hypothetical protein [Salmonella enterica]